MGMTEPAVGTDVLGMQTTARRDGDGYVLNGRKTFITNGPEADVVRSSTRSSTTASRRSSSSASFPGFSTSPKIPKIGMRASTMCELIFDDCRVPAENLLGTEGGGITNMMRNLEIERLGLAAMSLGIARRCLDVMVQLRARSAAAFGKPLAEHGQIQRYIGDSYAKIEAMRALIYNVAATVGPTQRNRLGTDAAKLFASTAAKEVADAAIQVLGGYGYCTEYRVEQFWRDAKLIEIGGGTLEAHQKNITRDLTRAVAATSPSRVRDYFAEHGRCRAACSASSRRLAAETLGRRGDRRRRAFDRVASTRARRASVATLPSRVTACRPSRRPSRPAGRPSTSS